MRRYVLLFLLAHVLVESWLTMRVAALERHLLAR